MVEIDRQPAIGAGQELGLSECAGPRPPEIGQLDIAALHDLQCRDQLALEEGLAAGACHIGKSMRQEELSLFVAEIAFDAPQRRNDMAVDAIVMLHRGKRGAVLLQHGLARRDALAIDEEGHIVPDRRAVFGLRAREADRLLIEGDVGERPCRQPPVDAGRNGLPLYGGNTGRKRRRFRRAGGGKHDCRQGGTNRNEHTHLGTPPNRGDPRYFAMLDRNSCNRRLFGSPKTIAGSPSSTMAP